MAIKTEHFDVNGRDFIRTYSDAGFKLRQIETGVLYDDAVDVMPCRYTYAETDEPIDEEPLEADEVVNILLGENE